MVRENGTILLNQERKDAAVKVLNLDRLRFIIGIFMAILPFVLRVFSYLLCAIRFIISNVHFVK